MCVYINNYPCYLCISEWIYVFMYYYGNSELSHSFCFLLHEEIFCFNNSLLACLFVLCFFLLGVPELKRTHRSAQMSDTESWLLFSAVLCATLLHSAFAIFSNFWSRAVLQGFWLQHSVRQCSNHCDINFPKTIKTKSTFKNARMAPA